MQLDFVWLVADTLNALMAVPNLISLLLLSPVIVRLTNAYFSADKAEKDLPESIVPEQNEA